MSPDVDSKMQVFAHPKARMLFQAECTNTDLAVERPRSLDSRFWKGPSRGLSHSGAHTGDPGTGCRPEEKRWMGSRYPGRACMAVHTPRCRFAVEAVAETAVWEAAGAHCSCTVLQGLSSNSKRIIDALLLRGGFRKMWLSQSCN